MAKKDRLNAKAAHQAEQDAQKQAQKEAQEASKWKDGAKGLSKKDSEEEKRLAQRARKADAAALLKAEEEALKGAGKRISRGSESSLDSLNLGGKKTLPAAFLRGADKAAAKKAIKVEEKTKEIEKYGTLSGVKTASVADLDEVDTGLIASNIDDALQVLDIAGSGDQSGTATSSRSSDKPLIGTNVERHPERRVKAAYAAYEERMLPQLRKENPSLRLTQVKELLWKLWQKAPENPFNQQFISHTSTKEEEKEVLAQMRSSAEQRLRGSN